MKYQSREDLTREAQDVAEMLRLSYVAGDDQGQAPIRVAYVLRIAGLLEALASALSSGAEPSLKREPPAFEKCVFKLRDGEPLLDQGRVRLVGYAIVPLEQYASLDPGNQAAREMLATLEPAPPVDPPARTEPR